MHNEFNEFQQPIGPVVPDWRAPPIPSREPMEGRYCRLEALDPDRHAISLFASNSLDTRGVNWTYLPYGPFASFGEYREWLEKQAISCDPLFFAIVDRMTDEAVGVASYMDIRPKNGSIEVGHINFSPRLQRTRAATEAMVLMMARAFDSGYRRYQWKCNALNAPSRAAAQRLGLSYEGTFRQATVVKGRSRDSAWYAAIDSEWPALREAFKIWLERANFDERGKQRICLSTLTKKRGEMVGDVVA
ncbi:MAG: GNAT family protein [Pirellula sp.]